MTKIVFVGESEARDIVVPGGFIHAVKGVPVDVPDDVAQSLLEQDIYEPAKASTKQEKD